MVTDGYIMVNIMVAMIGCILANDGYRIGSELLLMADDVVTHGYYNGY